MEKLNVLQSAYRRFPTSVRHFAMYYTVLC